MEMDGINWRDAGDKHAVLDQGHIRRRPILGGLINE
jgi:hypothetical protein